MRTTLTNDIDRAKYDALVRDHGYKTANEWVRRYVTLYDVFEAPRADRAPHDENLPASSRFAFRATMDGISMLLAFHSAATTRVLGDLEKLQISFIFQARNPAIFYGIRVAAPNLTPQDGTSYEVPTDMKRLHEASYVAVHVPDPDGGPAREMAFDGRLLDIALDVGPHVWVHASYADHLPEGAVQVGDGRSPGYSVGGTRIISVPAEWCTFYTDVEAEGIQLAKDADEQLMSYAR